MWCDRQIGWRGNDVASLTDDVPGVPSDDACGPTAPQALSPAVSTTATRMLRIFFMMPSEMVGAARWRRWVRCRPRRYQRGAAARYHGGIADVDRGEDTADSRTVGIQVLGPLAVGGADGYGLRDRVVLEVLVVRANEVVGPGGPGGRRVGRTTPPVSWPKVVQGCISRLRKHLGRDAIETTAYGGYVLRVNDDQIDARRFERLLARARDHLADHDPDRASYVLDEALSLWRGRALADLDDWEPGRTEAERLDGLRMDAQELRVEAEIAAGRARASLE